MNAAPVLRGKALIALALLLSFLVACSSSPPTATPLPTPLPTATLRPATSFTDGAYEAVQGKVLFVESIDVRLEPQGNGKGTCIMKEVICETFFGFKDGLLHIIGPRFKLGPVVVGYSTSCSESGDVDRRRMCACDALEAAERLPFTTRDERIVVRAVNAHGAAVVEIEGNTMWLEPGQSIESQWQDPVRDGYGCHHIQTWTNHGLLDEGQIVFR